MRIHLLGVDNPYRFFVYHNDQWLPNCIWADEEAGEAECLMQNGLSYIVGEDGCLATYLIHGRIRIVQVNTADLGYDILRHEMLQMVNELNERKIQEIFGEATDG